MNIQQYALNTPRRITTARDRDCRVELSKSVSTYLFTFSKKSKRNTVEAAHHRSTPDDRQQQKTPGCCLLSCHPGRCWHLARFTQTKDRQQQLFLRSYSFGLLLQELLQRRPMDVVAIEGLRSAHLEHYFLRLCAHFEALATMVLILGGAHDIVATTAVAPLT